VFLLFSSISTGKRIIFITNETPSSTKEPLNMNSSKKKDSLSIEYENFILQQFTAQHCAFVVISFRNVLQVFIIDNTGNPVPIK
jgi:hypothetical protein